MAVKHISSAAGPKHYDTFIGYVLAAGETFPCGARGWLVRWIKPDGDPSDTPVHCAEWELTPL